MHNYCNTENCRYHVGLLYDPAKSSPPLTSQSIVLSVSLIIIIIRFAITGIDRHIFVMSQRSNSGKKCTWEKFSVTFTVICAIKPNSAVQFVVNTLFAIKNQDFFLNSIITASWKLTNTRARTSPIIIKILIIIITVFTWDTKPCLRKSCAWSFHPAQPHHYADFNTILCEQH